MYCERAKWICPDLISCWGQHSSLQQVFQLEKIERKPQSLVSHSATLDWGRKKWLRAVGCCCVLVGTSQIRLVFRLNIKRFEFLGPLHSWSQWIDARMASVHNTGLMPTKDTESLEQGLYGVEWFRKGEYCTCLLPICCGHSVCAFVNCILHSKFHPLHIRRLRVIRDVDFVIH